MSGLPGDPLPRTIGAGALAALTAGIVIGSGIFRTPSEIAALVGSPSLILLVWVVGGAITLCLGLCLAELGAMFPRVGGLYVYLEEAFGKPVAFVFGWTFLLINPANWAAISLIAAAYIGAALGLEPGADRWIATAALAVVTIMNVASVTLATRFTSIFTFAKAAALLSIAAVIIVSGVDAGEGSARGVGSMGAFGLALIAVLWPYEGVAAASAMAGEVRDPSRNIPRGLIGGVLIITFLYLVINVAFLAALSPDAMAASRFVARDAAMVVLGESGGVAVGAAAAAYARVEPDYARESPFDSLLKPKKEPGRFVPDISPDDHAWAATPLPAEVFTAKEQKCLAEGIYFEARGEELKGQAAVAQVILNRVRNPAYPSTICGVVYQNENWRNRCQFSFACDRIPDLILSPWHWKTAKEIAMAVTAGKIWFDDVGSSTHYHATYVKPPWGRTMKRVAKIGKHIFYRTYGGGWS